MKNLDSRVEDAFPIINKIMSEFEANKEAEQVNELEPDAEPIDAPVQAPVDHGAVVQSFLTDPKQKLVLRKDDSADKMLKVTKFTNKNTMLSSILSDIASRLLTKSGEEDRVANFASRVADEMEQENSAAFKPSPDYMKNKKIAIQLAKRYIDDYKKMEKDPEFEKQVRMDPEDFNPKKHPKLDKRARGEAVEFEEWAESVATEYAQGPKDPEIEKKDKENATKLDVTKADKMMNTTAYKRMKAGTPGYSDKTNEGNQFAQAVQKAKAAGMKAGDKFKVGNDEYTLKDAIEMAGLPLEEFFSEEEMEVPEQAQAEAEAINTELDRIKTLANLS